MRVAVQLLIALTLSLTAVPVGAGPSRDAVLELARRGWVYDFRTALMRRPPNAPEIRISARSLRGAYVCLLGEMPHPLSREVLDAFGALLARTSGVALRIDPAGPDAQGCADQPVILRLFSTVAPVRDFGDDLARMDASFGIGFPPNRRAAIIAPAQAQTFFGLGGQATHLMVMQPPTGVALSDTQRRFYASILIEELYQAFTFGMDVLIFDTQMRPISKLQEYPVNLRNLPWASQPFMEGLLATSPAGLCGFDIFMLHALGQTDLDRTNSDELVDYLDAEYDTLARQSRHTLATGAFDVLIDPACAEAPE